MYLGFCIKINTSFFVPFAEHNTLAFLEVNIINVQPHQFPYSYPGRIEQIDYGEVAQITAAIAHFFYFLVGDNFFYGFDCFNFMNAPHWALNDIVFLLEPSEET